jgi:hypothetical protein
MIVSAWLGLSLLVSAFAWLANRKLVAVMLPVAAALVAGALWLPTGTPRFTQPPPGKYTVLGYRIDVGGAIYVLLDNGTGAPVYYVLPYSNGKANRMQDALNEGDGKGVTATFTGEPDGETFDGPPPVTGKESKTPETPMFSSGRLP